jgi:hypothetical protein
MGATVTTKELAVTMTNTNIFDIGTLSVQSEMYEAWVFPDLHPDERQPVLKNWHPEDLAAYCGGVYTEAVHN